MPTRASRRRSRRKASRSRSRSRTPHQKAVSIAKEVVKQEHRSSSMRASLKQRPKQKLNKEHYKGVAQVGKALRSEVSGASRLALALMMPHQVRSARFRTRYQDCPTAIAAPFAIMSNNWTAVQPIPLLADGRHLACISRQPLNALIAYEQNPSKMESAYRLFFRSDTVIHSTGGLPPKTAPQNHYVTEVVGTANHPTITERELPVTWMLDENIGSATHFHPHGDIQYAGTVQGSTRRGIWIDGFDVTTPNSANGGTLIKAQGNWTGGQVAAQVTLVLYRLSGTTWIVETEIAKDLTAGTSVWTWDDYVLHVSGYFAFAFRIEAMPGAIATTGTVHSVVIHSWGPAWGHHPIPHIDAKEGSIETAMVTGASLMVSPQATLLDRTGTITGCQLPPGVSWLKAIADPDSLTSSYGAVTMDLKEGMYGFMRPNHPSVFQFTSPFRIEDGVVFDIGENHLIPPGGWLVMQANVPKVDALYSPGATYTTVAYQVEFRTTDTWFDQRLGTLRDDAVVEAERLVEAVPQFYCNPFHFSDITKWLGNAVKTIWKSAPTLLGAVGNAIPEAKPVTSTAAGILRFIQDL